MRRASHRSVVSAWQERYNLSPHMDSGNIVTYLRRISNQLCRCKSDEARRLILGISEQFAEGEQPE